MKLKLSQEELAKTWIISDPHFGHRNCAGPECSVWSSGYRTFKNEHDMDEELLWQINRLVQPDDILINLGDWCMGRKGSKYYRDRINCRTIHHVNGNHDRSKDIRKAGFTTVSDYLEIHSKDVLVCMSHYPMLVWNRHHRGAYMLHGHCHNSLVLKGADIYKRKILDVGVDSAYHLTGEYRPFKLLEALDLCNKEIIAVDHHNEKTND